MAIVNNNGFINNSGFVNKPLNTTSISRGSATKSADAASVSEVSPVEEKTTSEQFSMVLSEKQKDSLHESLGYDQPSAKQRGAVNSYTQVANQAQRESIMESMSFHFVV